MLFFKDRKKTKRKIYLAVDNSKNFNDKKTYPITSFIDYYDRDKMMSDFMKDFLNINNNDLDKDK